MKAYELFVLGLGAATLVGVANAAFVYKTQDDVTITVKGKERIVETHEREKGKTDVSSKYLVFAENETFENTDSFLVWKFNSSDVQGSLDQGKSYDCSVYGWRVPFLSWYRNIVSCKPAAQQAATTAEAVPSPR